MREQLIWLVISISLGIIGLALIPRPYNAVSIVIPLGVFILKVLLPWFGRRFVVTTLNEDIVYLITHMYAISTGKPPREKLFTLGGVAGGYGELDNLLKRITVIAKEWGYGFARACKIMAREARNVIIRDFLTRFSEVLSVGEDPERFLNVERRAILSEYQAYYARLMDLARLLLGIYSSASSSMLFLAITMLFFLLLFGANVEFLAMSYIAIMVSVGGLVYILYRVFPRDKMTHDLEIHPKTKQTYRVVALTSLSGAIGAGALVYWFTRELSYTLILVGILMGLPGLIARRAERIIRSIDSFFPTFVRSFGLTYATVPNQVRTLRSVLRADYGPLNRLLKRLYARLSHGVMPKIAWKYFIGESWSESVRRNVNILFDAIDTGSDVGRTGVVLSDTSANLINIRKQREQISRSFEMTMYVMHALTVTILVFVVSLLQVFQQFVYNLGIQPEAQEYATLISFLLQANLDPVRNLSGSLIIFMSIANGLAIKVAQGGMYETVWVHLSLLFILSGAVMMGAMVISQTLLGAAVSVAPPIPIS